MKEIAGQKSNGVDIFPLARKNKEMAVTDAFYQITAICAYIQFTAHIYPNYRKIKIPKKRSARILLQVSRHIMKKIT